MKNSWNTYPQWTHSACCFCDLRFPNTQQVTVNPIASPRSTTTRRPINPPKEAVGQLPTISLLANVTDWSTLLVVVAGWFVQLVVVCSRHVWRVWLIVLLITEPITSWYVLHTTPRSMESSTDWSSMSTHAVEDTIHYYTASCRSCSMAKSSDCFWTYNIIIRHTWQPSFSLPSVGKPSVEQTNSTSWELLFWTVPQRPPTHTSTRPSLMLDPPTSLISPSAQSAVIHKHYYTETVVSKVFTW